MCVLTVVHRAWAPAVEKNASPLSTAIASLGMEWDWGGGSERKGKVPCRKFLLWEGIWLGTQWSSKVEGCEYSQALASPLLRWGGCCCVIKTYTHMHDCTHSQQSHHRGQKHFPLTALKPEHSRGQDGRPEPPSVPVLEQLPERQWLANE